MSPLGTAPFSLDVEEGATATSDSYQFRLYAATSGTLSTRRRLTYIGFSARTRTSALRALKAVGDTRIDKYGGGWTQEAADLFEQEGIQ